MSGDRANQIGASNIAGAGQFLLHAAAASPDRQRSLDRLRRESFDILVIGGGITGAGIALDAALRGLNVALIEKGDFASGTSSASSKLIHGGLRYLEHGQFGLVREALRERHILLRIAPHLVRPLRVLVPHYARAGRPRWMVKLGLTLYDWLAGRERIGRHSKLEAAELVSEVPGLRTDGLQGGFEFFDAQMDDARLCLEVVLTAVTAGTAAANYVQAVEMRRDRSGQVCGCEVVDHVSGEPLGITARRVVNAAGPWLDQICRIDDSTAPRRLASTKGVHIILPNTGLKAGLLITHPADSRVMFVLPWMNRTLVGTTDTFSDGQPDDVAAGPEDTDYLLAAINHYFGQHLARSDVIATLAGLRPLFRRSARGPSAMSREFAIVRSRYGLWSIAGGKYTTYRSMAESLVDRVVADLGFSPKASPSCTARHRLIGAPLEEWERFCVRERSEIVATYRLEPELASHLINRYGVRARLVAADDSDDPIAWQSVVPGEPEVWSEFRYQSEYEMAVCPSDHLLRRTHLGLFHRDVFARELAAQPHCRYSLPPERGRESLSGPKRIY